MLLCNSDEDPDKESLYVNVLRAERVAGVIMSPTKETTSAPKILLAAGIPTVVIDHNVLGMKLDSVLTNNLVSRFNMSFQSRAYHYAKTFGKTFFSRFIKRTHRSLSNNDIAFWLISQRMLPPVASIIPLYLLFQNLKMLDTHAALIITYTAVDLPIVVWLMRDYFANIPEELEESACVDGASPYRVLWSIVLPLSTPGLVATFLFVLVFAWNEYLIALFLSLAKTQTMPLLVAGQNGTRGPQWGYMSVLILVMIGPVIAMAIALERYISRGFLVGAVKG
ncbi:MAG: ABC transporter permease subunit [Trueperaceae bacterium]